MLDDVFAELQGRPFASMAEAQRFIDARVREYNTRPQPELGGLSPLQMSELLAGDWETTGPLRINATLGLEEIGEPDFLHNAVAFLTMLRDEGPAKATAGGSLSREAVTRILPRLHFEEGYLDDLRRVNKVLNEGDVGRLEILRYVLGFAGLIHRRKGFRISPAGRALLDNTRRGELLALLFRTFFRTLDLRAIGGWDDDTGLQQTIAFTFWKLRTETESWASAEHLARGAWLENATDPPPPDFPLADDSFLYDLRFRMRVLEPLVWFGLLDSRELPRQKRWERPIQVRKTPLYDRLLRFDFSAR